MKLYATVTSERDSRPVRKGGDSHIVIMFGNGVRIVQEWSESEHTITTYYQKENRLIVGDWTRQTEIDKTFYNKVKS